MGSELLLIVLLRMQLALSLAVLVVLALRVPARRFIGAELGYGLWSLPPAAALSSLIPPLDDFFSGRAHDLASADPLRLSTALQVNRVWERHAPEIILAWLTGVAAAMLLLAVREIRFRRCARKGLVGPAMVGLASPRLVVPKDFRQRFCEDERQLIRRHERTHVEGGHPAHNAIAAAVAVLAWFNPLVALGAAAFRMDQELACDAAVLARTRVGARAYGELLLKASCAIQGPLSCSLSAEARRLGFRLRRLQTRGVDLDRYEAGVIGLLGSMTLLVLLTWALSPADGLSSQAPLPASGARVAHHAVRTGPRTRTLQLELVRISSPIR